MSSRRFLPVLRLAFCPILLAALLATGLDRQWNVLAGRGMWAAGVRSFTGTAALDFGLLAFFLALVAGIGGGRFRRALPAGMAVGLVLAQAVSARLAWPVLTAPMPWGVDHSSFLYRLHEVRATFPALGGWSPWWNAGAEHWFGVTSGIHGWAALVSPLLVFFEPDVFEAPALFFWLFIGFPWLAVLSLRACGARWSAALAGGMAILACDRATFLYAWQYGIVGGMTTCGLTLPLVALAYRVIALRRGGTASAVALGILGWLSCLWTPGVFTCLGLGLAALLFARSWTRRSFVQMAVAAGLALLLLLPWLWGTLGPSRGIVKYVAADVSRPPLAQMVRLGFGSLGMRLLEWHPAVLAFGLGGALFAAHRRMRRFMAPVLLFLAAVVLSAAWKRQSQFDRVAFQMAYAAAFPAAILCGRLLSRPLPRGFGRRWAMAAAQGVTLAALVAGLRIACAHAAGTGGFPVQTASAKLLAFTDWIREHVPADGRLAFMGQMENYLGGGTVAYLPILTGREMMGDDYYTFPRGMTERDFPPRIHRSSTERLLAYSRCYGITHWAVWHPRYVRFFDEETDHFTLATTIRDHGPEIRVYRLLDPSPGRFQEGEGVITAWENHLLVRPADPAAERLVLRYRWRDNLRCRTPGATIEPFNIGGGIQLITVHPNGAAEVEIGYRASRHPLPPDPGGWLHH
jgi:hypothetical protein